MFEVHRDDELLQFASPILVRIEPEAASQLHRESGGTLFFASLTGIDVGSLEDTKHVNPGVTEEVFVLGRDDRLHQNRRNLRILNQAALLTIAGKVGDQLRFEHEGFSVGVVLEGDDAGDLTVGKFDEAGLTTRIRVAARKNFYGAR